MTGIVIPIWNRPSYLIKTFNSLLKADFPKDCMIYISDDGSNVETKEIIHDFKPPCRLFIDTNPYNIGNHYGIKRGFDFLYNKGCEIVMTLDADTLVKPNFIKVLTKLVTRFPDTIVSGFNTLVSHPGKVIPRHRIIKQERDYCLKMSCGGINLAMKEPVFRKFLEPCLVRNWDWNLSHKMQRHGKYFIISTPSVVQHIGIDSSMKHINADIAIDF